MLVPIGDHLAEHYKAGGTASAGSSGPARSAASRRCSTGANRFGRFTPTSATMLPRVLLPDPRGFFVRSGDRSL